MIRQLVKFSLCFFLLLLCGFAPNDTFTNPEGNRKYVLIEKLGVGSFGEVWKARVPGTNEIYALKFYKEDAISQGNLRRASRFAGLPKPNAPQNLLQIFTKERVIDTKTQKTFDIIRSEVADASVESLSNSDFRLETGLSNRELKRRIQNSHQLLQDLLNANNELTQLGLVHHDENPRNILKVGKHYKLADFDGVTEVGSLPPNKSWEGNFGPLEYSSETTAGSTSHMGDLSTLANTLFYLLHGKSSLEYYAESTVPALYASDPDKAVSLARRELNNPKMNVARESYQKCLINASKQLFESNLVPDSALKEFSFISKFILSALEVNPLTRQQKLNTLLPHLAPMFELPPINSRIRPSCPASLELLPEIFPQAG